MQNVTHHPPAGACRISRISVNKELNYTSKEALFYFDLRRLEDFKESGGRDTLAQSPFGGFLMTYEHILTQIEDGVSIITLNRPD